jgi:hypothetical protein
MAQRVLWNLQAGLCKLLNRRQALIRSNHHAGAILERMYRRDQSCALDSGYSVLALEPGTRSWVCRGRRSSRPLPDFGKVGLISEFDLFLFSGERDESLLISNAHVPMNMHEHSCSDECSVEC